MPREVLLAWWFLAYSFAGGALTITTHGPFGNEVTCMAALRAERQKPLTAASQCEDDGLS